jgi:hypothetical protein
MRTASGNSRRERGVVRTLARLGLAALAAAWLAGPPAPVPAATECASADAALDGGTVADVERAEAAYRAILADSPGSACAATGEQVATELVTAVALRRSGLDAAVAPHIVEALKLRPQTRLPGELRAAAPPPVHRSPWQQEPWPTIWDRLIILVALAVLAGLAWQVVGWLRHLRYVRLLIGAFAGPDQGDARSFSAVVGDHVQRLCGYRTGQRPDRVSKWGDPIAVPTDLVTAVPPVGLASALLTLLGKLVPSRDRALNGTLHVAGEGVVGVSCTLETRQGRVLDGSGIWATTYGLLPADAAEADRPEQRFPLAFPVAVWAFFQLRPDAKRLGTGSWRSYAAFGMGEDFDANGQVAEAELCYLRALDYDPENRPARLNLASMWLANGSAAHSRRAGSMLGGADTATWAECELRRLQCGPDERCEPRMGDEPDSFWYRAQYVLTAAAARSQLEEWCDGGEPPGHWGPAGQTAVERAEDLVRNLEAALGRPQEPGRQAQAFSSFLVDIEAASLVLWAGIEMVRRASQGTSAPERPPLSFRVDGETLTAERILKACGSGALAMPARARYNLACYHAVAAMVDHREGGDDRNHLEAALLELQLAAPSLPRSMLLHARDDVCFRELRDHTAFRGIVGMRPVEAVEPVEARAARS